ncbi:MAG: ABC transporter permease subunit [Clostridiaceae bacterium]
MKMVLKTDMVLKTKKKNNLILSIRRYWELYLIFLPVAIWFIIFKYVPMAGIILAFKKYNPVAGIFDSPWVGLDNFFRCFNSPAFLSSLRNTVIISLQRLIWGFPMPVVFAIFLNEVQQRKFKKVVQTVSYLPHFISWSVAGGIFYMLLSPTSGVVNTFLKSLGMQAINFLGDSSYFRSVVVATDIWKNMGWDAIIYLAALAGVDCEMYEAAYIDGASRLKRIIYITLPSISNIIVIMLILRVGHLFNVSFEQIFILLNPMVLEVGETLGYYIYRVGLYNPNNFGFGTAVGLFESVIGLALVITTNKLSKKINDDGGIW